MIRSILLLLKLFFLLLYYIIWGEIRTYEMTIKVLKKLTFKILNLVVNLCEFKNLQTEKRNTDIVDEQNVDIINVYYILSI
jgi:hypothetical protein